MEGGQHGILEARGRSRGFGANEKAAASSLFVPWCTMHPCVVHGLEERRVQLVE